VAAVVAQAHIAQIVAVHDDAALLGLLNVMISE